MVELISRDHLKWRHREFLVSGGLLSMACILPVVLPHSICPTQIFLGIPCPFCGLTRGIGQALHLNFRQAESFHLLSVPLAIFYLFRLLYLSFACVSPVRGASWQLEQTVDNTSDKIFLSAAVLIFVFKYFLTRQ